MITDESYREYLRPGDLRTAEDALSWLRERAIAADEGFVSRAATLDEAHADLSARLDRERRQACRRAALLEWRRISGLLRGGELPFLAHGDEVPPSIGILPFLTVGSHSPDGIRWGSATEIYGWIYGALTRALAFRAAARTP